MRSLGGLVIQREVTPAGVPEGVRVWLLSFALAGGRLDALMPLLSAHERARCLRLRRPPDRVRFAAARAALRMRLGALLGVPAAAVGIDIDTRGKPVLTGEPALHFNLSHAGTCGLLALSESGPVGVDIEAAGCRPDVATLAACLSPAERRHCDGAANARDFFRVWCGKEAVLKAWGVGFGMDPRALSVVPASAREYAVSPPPGYTAARAWPLRAPRGYAAALALSDPVAAVLGRQSEMAAEGG